MASQADGRVLVDAHLMVNVVTAYERVRLTLLSDRVRADWPGTVLGVVPVDRTHLDMPLAEIRFIGLVPLIFPARLVVVGVLVFSALYFDAPLPVTLALSVAAAFFLLLTFVVGIGIVGDSKRAKVPVCWLQRKRALEFIEAVRAHLPASRSDDA